LAKARQQPSRAKERKGVETRAKARQQGKGKGIDAEQSAPRRAWAGRGQDRDRRRGVTGWTERSEDSTGGYRVTGPPVTAPAAEVG
jgi:hypothetical protein